MTGRLRRRAAAVAPLVAAAVAASGCGILGGDDSYHVTAYFPRAVSLYESSQVRVLGLPAGEVSDVVVEGDRVRVELEIDSDVPVPTDASAALVPQSLIGERYVQLMPAWVEGEERLQDLPPAERVIALDRTVVPVEPDEALARLDEFLQELNPDDLGRFIDNAAEDLEGNGANLNRALETVSGLVDSFARRDDELAAIVDNFDRFTATLVQRESQLGEVLDNFAGTTAVLAQERRSLEALLDGLARISVDGFDLVAEHSARLRTDIDTLGRLGQSVVANLDAVAALLDSGPLLVEGIADAYNPTLRAMNLRTQFGPLAQQVLEPILQSILGDDFRLPCVPVDTACPDVLGVEGLGESAPVETDVPDARTPIDDVLAFLGAPSAADLPAPGSSTADRVAGGVGSLGRFLREAAETLTGVGR